MVRDKRPQSLGFANSCGEVASAFRVTAPAPSAAGVLPKKMTWTVKSSLRGPLLAHAINDTLMHGSSLPVSS